MIQLPLTLSNPLAAAGKATEENRWQRAMNYYLDFMETGASYVSVVLLAMLRNQVIASGSPAKPGVQAAVNKIDAKRPLSFGDWVNDILAPLSVEAAKQFPQNKFVVDVVSVAGRKQNVFLPSKGDMGVVQIRNKYKGHGTTLSESLYEDVVQQLKPKVERFATAISAILECGVDFQKDLFPLILHSENNVEYVFQTLREEEVAYVSTNQNALPLSSTEYNSAFDRWMQTLLPSFDIAKDLNWIELVAAMQETSSAYMKDIYSQKKYNREQFVERELLNKSFQDFIRTHYTTLIDRLYSP